MKKKLFFAAMALVALASCTDDQFVVENNNSPNPNTGPDQAIVFNSGANAITRATHEGGDAAELLNKKFVFAGTKGTSASSFVFDQYTAEYVASTAHTTESNSNDWEYVNFTPGSGSGVSTQTIKYWDYGTTQYDFAAYSLGKGVEVTPATDPATYNYASVASAIAAGTKSYTLNGSADQLKACYISDLVTAYNRDGVKDYGNVVTFSFRSLAAKVRLAFYETVPGYSVKDLKFYTSSSADLADDGTESDPTLFASSSVLPSGNGSMTITFPTTGWDNSPHGSNATDYNKAHVAFSGSTSSTFVLEDLADFAAKELAEADGSYLGRTSNTATYAGGLVSGSGKYYTILPYETGDNLTLRIKYTLVSTDGSGENIYVDNATAVIPAELARWSPNYAYTYIFKISDMTNGSTGVDGDNNVVTGLTPITLNAVVIDSEDGVQETITTVATPSITTYTKGKVVTVQSEYSTDANIYIIVNNGTSNEELTVNENAKLYTVTLEDGAAQTLNEASVANALKNGVVSGSTHTVTDAKGKKLVVTDASGLNAVTQIDAADSPTGNLITVNGARFKPTTAGTYVFQYLPVATAAVPYTEESAKTHNAGLTGALNSTDALTDAQATAYNTAMNASISSGTTLTPEQAAAYNATLTGAVSAGDPQSAATYKSADECNYKIIIVQ